MAEQYDHAPAVVRRELRLFLRVSELAGLRVDEQARSLRLSREDWARWLNVLRDAPLPASPALPLMLRRLGTLNHRLARVAQRRLQEAA